MDLKKILLLIVVAGLGLSSCASRGVSEESQGGKDLPKESQKEYSEVKRKRGYVYRVVGQRKNLGEKKRVCNSRIYKQ